MAKSKRLFPTAIRIGPVTYQVKWIADLRTENRHKARGAIVAFSGAIEMDTRERGRAALETLLHEAIHGVVAQMEIKGLTEHAVGALGYGLTEMLLDNPDVIAAYAAESARRAARRNRRSKPHE